jgi:hypothetical protein
VLNITRTLIGLKKGTWIYGDPSKRLVPTKLISTIFEKIDPSFLQKISRTIITIKAAIIKASSGTYNGQSVISVILQY